MTVNTNYKKYAANLPAEFGKVLEAVFAVYEQLKPEDIAKIRDWSVAHGQTERGTNIPEQFLPYLAWEMGCLYEFFFLSESRQLTAEDILKFRELRKYEGTDYGVKHALELIPVVDSAEIEQVGACVFNLVVNLVTDEQGAFDEKEWKFFYYLLDNYKRKSASCKIDFKRSSLLTELEVHSGVRCDRLVGYPVQSVVGYITLSSPASGANVFCGDTVTISGASDQSDGTTVYITVTLPDSTTASLTATLNSGAYSATYTIPTNHGPGSVKFAVRAVVWTAEATIYAAFHSIALASPADGDEIQIGATVSIAGTTDYADGTPVNIAKIVNGVQTTLAIPFVENGAFSYNWVSAGVPGDITLKAWFGNIEDSVDVTLTAAINVIAPAAGDEITVGEPFNVEVETEQVGNVTVYVGSTLIATIPIENGEANGTATIPANLAHLGTMFIIEGGEEVPVGDESSISLKFVDASGFAVVNVTAKLSRDFGIGTETGAAKVSPDIDKNYTLDLFGTLEAAGTSVIGDREIEDKLNAGTLKASAELDHYYSRVDCGDMSAQTEPIDHEENEEFGFGEITFEATITEGE